MKLTYNLSDVDSVAVKILTSAKSKYFLFYGEMGVGKTTLIKAIAKHLQILEKVVSPTFSIVNTYVSASQKTIYHFDFYRLERPEEVLDIGFEDYLEQGDWLFMEWPENIADYLPVERTEIHISGANEENREIVLSNVC